MVYTTDDNSIVILHKSINFFNEIPLVELFQGLQITLDVLRVIRWPKYNYVNAKAMSKLLLVICSKLTI